MTPGNSNRRKRPSASSGGESQGEPKFKALGRIMDRHDLADLPKPQPMLDECLDLLTVQVMPGDTGTNKTFVATVGWACSIATGTPWLGREVRIDPCPVILVVGEGEHGLDARISAWEMDNGVKIPRGRVHILVRPDLSADGNGLAELEKLAVERGARFIVFDTVSSLIPDIDETKDTAQLIAAMHDIKTRINGSIVLLHHTGWNSPNRARGATQFEQNADAVTVLQKTEPNNPENCPVQLWRKKVKDGPSGARMTLERVPVGDSCVLKEVAASGKKSMKLTTDDVRREIFALLDREPLTHTANQAEEVLMSVIGTGAARDAVRKLWKQLVIDGRIRSKRTAGPDGGRRDPRWERTPSAEVPADSGGLDGGLETGPAKSAAKVRRRPSKRRT